jgi:hypothetical protein
MHNDELKLLIASKLDVAEFLDIIGYTMYELVEALGDEVDEHSQELQKACE